MSARRSLYGQCIFSQKTSANTALSDELLAATKSPQFAANALLLRPSFNATILPYETEYFATTTAGAAPLTCLVASALPQSVSSLDVGALQLQIPHIS